MTGVPTSGSTAGPPGPPVELRDVTVTYAGQHAPAVRNVSLTLAEGDFHLVVGPTGSGKSTLLGAICGRVPHATGGRFEGEVIVAGRSTRQYPPRELCDVVGFVPQDPAASFVTDTVEEEVAYVMENLGVPAADMARRIEDTLDLMGIASLRGRAPRTLSGGQQQRVAIAAVLAAAPRVLVLDEPTSALDPAAADDVLAALTRLVHDLGLTLVVAEHRLERVAHLVDSVVAVPGDGSVRIGAPASLLGDGCPAPPVTRLGRRLHWTPPPVSVREARRTVAGTGISAAVAAAWPGSIGASEVPGTGSGDAPVADAPVADPPVAVRVDGVRVVYPTGAGVTGVDLHLRAGGVTAIMGRNGAGKSTLLNRLGGLPAEGARTAGVVSIDGADPVRLAPRELVRRVGLVPQDHGLLLLEDTVAAECAAADRDARLERGTTLAVLEGLLPGVDPSQHPRDLSEGGRLCLALAVILGPAPPVVLLDEPTRGLDYAAKDRLVGILAELARAGHAVVMASHDVELVAESANRVVVMAEGRVVDDGPTREVVCRSPVFSPQMARVFAPAPVLTVDDVMAALAREVP